MLLGGQPAGKPYRASSGSPDGVKAERDPLKEAVDLWLDNDAGLEIRFAMADRLLPDGFYRYYFGTDPEFVDRVDAEAIRIHHILNRPIMQKVVMVGNL